MVTARSACQDDEHAPVPNWTGCRATYAVWKRSWSARSADHERAARTGKHATLDLTTDTRHQRQVALRTTTLNSMLAIKAIKGQDQRRKKERKKERHEEQLFSNKEGVATIATHGDPEQLSPARKHLVEAQTLVPNTRGWGRSRRPNIMAWTALACGRASGWRHAFAASAASACGRASGRRHCAAVVR